jgi:hypothetical protein
MRRPKIAVAAGAALILAGGVTAAFVATGSAAHARPAKAHFDATYYEGNAIWTCSGTHTISKSGGAKDTETCLITGDTTGYAKDVGTYTGRPGVTLPGSPPGSPPERWHSDYDHVVASGWTITFTNTHQIGYSGLDTYQAHITAFYNS